MAAHETQPKVHPAVAHLHTFGAIVCLGGGGLHLIHMIAFGSHFMILSSTAVRVTRDPTFPNLLPLRSWIRGNPSVRLLESPRGGSHRTSKSTPTYRYD